MLFVSKTGWVMAVTVDKKTPKGTHITILENNRKRFVSNNETKVKLVETIAEAYEFIGEK